MLVNANITAAKPERLAAERAELQDRLTNNKYVFGTSKASCVIPNAVTDLVEFQVGRGRHVGFGRRYQGVETAGLSKATLRSIQDTVTRFQQATGNTVELGSIIVLYAPFRYVVEMRIGNTEAAMLYTSNFAAGTGLRQMVRQGKNNLKLGTPTATQIKEWLA